ncbi:Crp/Fnr family transcriptional regulator [Aquimarina sp. RZ0]|uniref:Crp/Fnr family transcriptional regulator n=1 Tax=Aquimarina sp. RZ0 TaxID=2607730 RepID=UPI0011F29BC5|nr:Crp/Fnr family transcriptional regulator [Aquimarina sp. RZ0]KAA1247157.1 Crp/Fnr family transcriptional regulator [Aquimarina sp. RZ0]
MKEKLENILKSFSEFSEDDIIRGLDCFVFKSFKKDEILIEAGQTCDWIAFICSGIVRNYYSSSKDEEVTYCLTFPNKFIAAYSSFISGKKTFENIHALIDTEVLIIKKNQFSELTNTNNNWLKFSNYFAEQSYVLMENRLLALQMESAEKRYKDLIINHPEFIQLVPLKYIASYLGITQRHLSRLRKKNSF